MRTQVAIVGAGPVGLAAAIELGQRGIRCEVIERNDRVGYAPRAKTTNVRTREHLRRWGIADRLAAASPLGVDYPSSVTFVTRLSGDLLHRFENAMYCRPGPHPLYAEHGQWIPQYKVEAVLRDHAASLPTVRLRFQTECVRIEQDTDRVRLELHSRAGGPGSTLECAYVIGADGAGSTVRAAIGATLSGERALGRHTNVIFRAPGLASAHRHGPAIMYWLVNADLPGVTGPMDADDRWYFGSPRLPQEAALGSTDIPAMIRRATGIDCACEVLSADEWTASRMIADRYARGRIFLAGDACHLHPPFGGYGMNMGVADAVDLGWKMAAVLQGWGGPALLDTYEPERRAVHDLVMSEAVGNFALLGPQLFREGLEAVTAEGARIRAEVGATIAQAKIREFDTLGVTLGYRLGASAAIIDDGTEPPPWHFRDYRPSSHPGRRAPHAWLADSSALFDHFGAGFTLLHDRQTSCKDLEAWRRAGAATGVPLTLLAMPDADVAALYEQRFVLVRPDQHVAWRGNDADDAGRTLARVAGQTR